MAAGGAGGALVAAGLAVAAPGVSSGQTGDLLTNGGFEEPFVADGSVDFFDSVPGWTLAPGSEGGKIELQSGIAGEPGEQRQLLELDARGSTGVEQRVATGAGQRYVLRFSFSPRPNTATGQNRLNVSWAGTTVATLDAGAGGARTAWTCYTYILTGTGGLTALEFRDLGPSDTLGTYVDGVSLRPAGTADLVAPPPLPGACGAFVPTTTTTIAPTTSTTSATTTTTEATTTTTTTDGELPRTGDGSPGRLALGTMMALAGMAAGAAAMRSAQPAAGRRRRQ